MIDYFLSSQAPGKGVPLAETGLPNLIANFALIVGVIFLKPLVEQHLGPNIDKNAPVSLHHNRQPLKVIFDVRHDLLSPALDGLSAQHLKVKSVEATIATAVTVVKGVPTPVQISQEQSTMAIMLGIFACVMFALVGTVLAFQRYRDREGSHFSETSSPAASSHNGSSSPEPFSRPSSPPSDDEDGSSGSGGRTPPIPILDLFYNGPISRADKAVDTRDEVGDMDGAPPPPPPSYPTPAEDGDAFKGKPFIFKWLSLTLVLSIISFVIKRLFNRFFKRHGKTQHKVYMPIASERVTESVAEPVAVPVTVSAISRNLVISYLSPSTVRTSMIQPTSPNRLPLIETESTDDGTSTVIMSTVTQRSRKFINVMFSLLVTSCLALLPHIARCFLDNHLERIINYFFPTKTRQPSKGLDIIDITHTIDENVNIGDEDTAVNVIGGDDFIAGIDEEDVLAGGINEENAVTGTNEGDIVTGIDEDLAVDVDEDIGIAEGNVVTSIDRRDVLDEEVLDADEEDIVPPTGEEYIVPAIDEGVVVPAIDKGVVGTDEDIVPAVDEEDPVPPIDEEDIVPAIDEGVIIVLAIDEGAVRTNEEDIVLAIEEGVIGTDEEVIVPAIDQGVIVPVIDEEDIIADTSEEVTAGTNVATSGDEETYDMAKILAEQGASFNHVGHSTLYQKIPPPLEDNLYASEDGIPFHEVFSTLSISGPSDDIHVYKETSKTLTHPMYKLPTKFENKSTVGGSQDIKVFSEHVPTTNIPAIPEQIQTVSRTAKSDIMSKENTSFVDINKTSDTEDLPVLAKNNATNTNKSSTVALNPGTPSFVPPTRLPVRKQQRRSSSISLHYSRPLPPRLGSSASMHAHSPQTEGSSSSIHTSSSPPKQDSSVSIDASGFPRPGSSTNDHATSSSPKQGLNTSIHAPSSSRSGSSTSSPPKQGLNTSIHAPTSSRPGSSTTSPPKQGLNTSIHAPTSSRPSSTTNDHAPSSSPKQGLNTSIHAPSSSRPGSSTSSPPKQGLNTSMHAPSSSGPDSNTNDHAPSSPPKQGSSASIHALSSPGDSSNNDHAPCTPRREDLDACMDIPSSPRPGSSTNDHAPCTPRRENKNASMHAPSSPRSSTKAIPVVDLSPNHRVPRPIDPERECDIIVLVNPFRDSL